MVSLLESDILFNIQTLQNKHLGSLLQLGIILGKYHIHKVKWAEMKPNLNHFYNEFQPYINIIKHVDNKKASKTVDRTEKYFPCIDD